MVIFIKRIFMKSLFFCFFLIFGVFAEPLYIPGQVDTIKKLEKITWQTNISKNDIKFIKTNLNHPKYSTDVQRAVVDLVIIHDIKSLKSELVALTNKQVGFTPYVIGYLNSTNKINFLNELSKKKFYEDDFWEKQKKWFYGVKEGGDRFERVGLHQIIIAKQIKYNRVNKIYSEHIIKDFLSKIKNGIILRKWNKHKAKAKKEGWKIADDSGQ